MNAKSLAVFVCLAIVSGLPREGESKVKNCVKTPASQGLDSATGGEQPLGTIPVIWEDPTTVTPIDGNSTEFVGMEYAPPTEAETRFFESGSSDMLGKFNFIKQGFSSVSDLVKMTTELLARFGFKPKDYVILFDIRCSNCKVSISCSEGFNRHPWNRIEAEEGGILKFSTSNPFKKYRCAFHDGVKKRLVEFDVFGGFATKDAKKVYKIEDNRVSLTDPNTDRTMMNARPVAW